MVQITCDSCGKVKPTGLNPAKDEWIMGWDLEVETSRSVNHAIRFLDRWDDRRVMELGGVHLCSERCREKYLHRSRVA
jgi:hypothetical protein